MRRGGSKGGEPVRTARGRVVRGGVDEGGHFSTSWGARKESVVQNEGKQNGARIAEGHRDIADVLYS